MDVRCKKKARKNEEEEEEEEKTGKDRLSDLPDCIIHHIFSFLDTQYAVQTCVLSRRWKTLWASAPDLHFGNQFGGYPPFKRFVRKVLSRRDDIPVTKLYLGHNAIGKSESYSNGRRKKGKSLAGRVIKYAASHNLQHLSMGSDFHGTLQVLIHVGSFQSLKTLHLSRFNEVYLLSNLDLPFLTTLCLDSCSLSCPKSNSGINPPDPFSSSINLKSLVINRFSCGYVGILKISGPQLESLTMLTMDGSPELKVEIFAPELKSFRFRRIESYKFFFIDVPLSGMVNIDSLSERMAPFKKLQLSKCSDDYGSLQILSPVGSIQSLKTLHLSGFNEVFLLSTLKLPMLTTLYLNVCSFSSSGSIACIDSDPFASFINLKSLILIGFDCRCISKLKISGPQLESLTIDTMYGLPNFKVELFAPKLKIFNFGTTDLFEFSNLDLPLLETANIDASCEHMEAFENSHLNLMVMLRGLRHAQFLKLSCSTMEVLMKVPGVLEHQSSPFSRLKTLELKFHKNLVEIPASVMKFLLSGSTSLEIISIEPMKHLRLRSRMDGMRSEIAKLLHQRNKMWTSFEPWM